MTVLDIHLGLTASRLRDLLIYDPESGEFSWLPRVGTDRVTKIFNGQFAGHPAGSMADGWYTRICIDQRNYRAHRLAWLYMTGEWPECEVDHINLDKSDNRWSNLRIGSHVENCWNCGPKSRKRSGLPKGVTRSNSGGYRARIKVRGQEKHLGHFETKEAAAAAYVEGSLRYHPKFGRSR